jgi:predicted DNA-binding protein
VTYGLAADLARVIKGMTVRTKSQKVRNLISASLAHMDDMVILKDMHRQGSRGTSDFRTDNLPPSEGRASGREKASCVSN